jgi:predicted HNH restriction endonuclease
MDTELLTKLINEGNSQREIANKLELDKCILVCSNCHKEIHGGLIKI